MADFHFSLQKLRVLCAVVESGGVRRAAEELRVSEPVVSAHIASLQRHLGARVFERQGRGLRLTEAGTEIYRWAVDLLRGQVELERKLEALASGSMGAAVIAATMSIGNYVLAPILVRFRLAHPDATIELHMSAVENAVDEVIAGRADFCLVSAGQIDDTKQVELELIAEPRLVLVAAATNTSIPAVLTRAQVAELDFIGTPKGYSISRGQESMLAAVNVRRRVVIEFGSAESIKEALIADLGVAFLGENSVARELASGELRELRIEGVELRDRLFLVKRLDKRLSPLQERLVEAIRSGVSHLRPGGRAAG